MIKRRLRVGGSFLALVVLCNRLFSNARKYEVPTPDLDRDPNNLLEKYPPHLSFTPEEEERGKRELQRMGIKGQFVCLIVRDDAYLPQLGYHSFRDADIDTYMPACKELANRGYYVLRMGAKVKKPMSFTSPKIIDYAINGQWSDFMSVYLGAKCEFCISTGCGFDAIPYIFRRPICYTNYVPIENLMTFAPKSLAIWKHHHKLPSPRPSNYSGYDDIRPPRMTLKDIYDSGAGQFMRADEFEDAGITLVDNTPEEIKDVVLEMAAGPFVPKDTIRQSTFWRDFPRSISQYTQRPLHGEIRMRIGSAFLRQYSACTCGEFPEFIPCAVHD